MDWKEQMKEAMKMMKDACSKNNDWSQCEECPFDAYCDYLSGGAREVFIPADFEIK